MNPDDAPTDLDALSRLIHRCGMSDMLSLCVSFYESWHLAHAKAGQARVDGDNVVARALTARGNAFAEACLLTQNRIVATVGDDCRKSLQILVADRSMTVEDMLAEEARIAAMEADDVC